MSPGSDSFQWIDQNIVEAMDAPDEAFDYVFMLKDRDWDLILEIWTDRPAEWREAMAYVAGGGPIEESRPMLLLALCDESDLVASQAAISIANQYLEYPEDRIPVDANTIDQLRQLVTRLGKDDLEPVAELLTSLTTD